MNNIQPPPYDENHVYIPPPIIEQKQINFKDICYKYEIGEYFASKLGLLGKYEIVLIVDDSGSMTTTVKSGDIYAPPCTRWEEAKKTVKQVAEMALLFDKNGLDLYFLNRGTINNVTDINIIDNAFTVLPSGFTPITTTLQKVLHDKKDIIKEKKLLILIATDGQPTDYKGNTDVESLKSTLINRHPIDKIFVTFLACTDDNQTMEYLNDWDKNIKNLDVVDDYVSEKKEIQQSKGNNFKFTYGDYIVKALVGSIDPELDNYDEPSKSCCNLM
jgi:hypothetical protein